jgi:hypothetical protein
MRAPIDQHRRHRTVVGAVAAFNALSAGFGGYGLATGWLELDTTAASRLPWDSTVVGGLALAAVVAVPNAAVAVAALRRDPRYGRASIASGALLVGWIAVELAFIRELSFFHPLYAGIGLVQMWLGARQVSHRAAVSARS